MYEPDLALLNMSLRNSTASSRSGTKKLAIDVTLFHSVHGGQYDCLSFASSASHCCLCRRPRCVITERIEAWKVSWQEGCIIPSTWYVYSKVNCQNKVYLFTLSQKKYIQKPSKKRTPRAVFLAPWRKRWTFTCSRISVHYYETSYDTCRVTNVWPLIGSIFAKNSWKQDSRQNHVYLAFSSQKQVQCDAGQSQGSLRVICSWF